MKRLLFILILMAGIIGARASTNVVATVAFTNTVNGVTNGGTITINGDQRNYTNGVLNNAAIWIQSTNIVGWVATNTLYHLGAYRVADVYTIQFTNGTNIVIEGEVNKSLTVTLSAGIGTVSYVTNTFEDLKPLMLPLASLPTAAGRTNQQNRLIVALNDSYATGQVLSAASSFTNFLNKYAAQVASNKTFYAGVIDGARGSNIVALHGTNYWLRGGVMAEYSGSNFTSISSTGVGSNWFMHALTMSNGVNRGNAFTSPGSGSGSEQFGAGAQATGPASLAIFGSATGSGSIAIGSGSESGYGNDIALGTGSAVNATNGIAIGNHAIVGTLADGGIAIGTDSTVNGNHTNSIAMGYLAATTETNQIITGPDTKVRIPGQLQVSGTQTNTTFTGTNRLDGSIAWTRRDLSTLGNGNNIAVPFGTNAFVRLTGTLTDVASICGIVGGATTGGQNGQLFEVLNDTGYTVTFAVNTIDPVPANRIENSGGDVAITSGGSIGLIYETDRWRITGTWPTVSSVTNLSLASGSMATNTASFNLGTNDFVMNQYYTNSLQRAHVGASIALTNILAGDVSRVALFLDQDAGGTWEMQGRMVSLQGVALAAEIAELSAWLQPGARFLFTNLTSGTGAAAIQANSSQLVKQ